MMQMADPIYTHIPTTENPFVGRLDTFVTELKGRTTLPDLVKQMRGKFRDYDIQRVQRIMQDVPADTKFTPNEILEKLQTNYDPSGFKITQVTSPNSFYESMDNPWYNDSIQPKHSTIVLSSSGPTGSGISPEAAKEARDALLRLDPDYRSMNELTDVSQVKNYFEPLVATLGVNPAPYSQRALWAIGQIKTTLDAAETEASALRGFATGLRLSQDGLPTFSQRKQELLQIGGMPAEKVLPQAYLKAFQDSYEDLASGLTNTVGSLDMLPVFRSEDYPNANAAQVGEITTRFLDRDIDPLVRSMIRDRREAALDYVAEQEATFFGDQELKDFLASRASSGALAPGSNPSYTGQHRSVTNSVPNQISFSRASDVTANIPEIGPEAKGIYVHELQSDLLDDVRAAGGPRSLTPDELKTRFTQSNQALNALDDKLEENNILLSQLRADRDALYDPTEPRAITSEGMIALKALDTDIDRIRKESDRLLGRIDVARRGRDNLERRIEGDPTSYDPFSTAGTPLIDEAFVGMDTNPKALQQLMIKTAVKAAIDRGLDFVALTSPLHSSQPQLYERIPQNARDVVKDLGEGFQVQQVELDRGKGPFTTTAIVWGRDAAGKEGVNRLLTRGVPFKKGGEVSSSPTSQELLAQIDRSTASSRPAYGTASSAPRDPVQTESRNMLRRLSDAFGQNVTAPVVGSALDMTAGVGDLLQMGAKAGAKRLGIETKPFTPVSSAIQKSLGVAGYDPYSPAALAASVLLPAAGPLRAAGAATRPMMSMAAPGSAKETLSRLAPILDREASVAASAELAAMGARAAAPDNFTAEIAATVAGGGAYNTLDNILSSTSRGPTTSNVIKLGKTGGSNARNAADELREIFAENPLNPRELISNTAGATVYSMGDTLHLSDIRTFDPGKGGASKMLRSVLEVADKNNVPVTLTAENYSGDGLTTAQLVDWYKRNGFEVENDFGDDGVDMIRQPRNIAEEASGAARSTPKAADDLAALTAKAPTDTPEFKNWFGNSAITTSLEPNGKPRRLYHITPKNFDTFDVNRPDAVDPFSRDGSGPVIFMTDDAEEQMAAHKVQGYMGRYKEGSNVMPVYASIQNPLFIDNKLEAAERTRLNLSQGWPYLYTADDVSKLKAAGYDGVFSVNDDIPNEIVAFRPEQVKSAIGNEGTFDPTSPVITKAKGGVVTKNNVERMRNDNRKYL
jgi:hypothetical protein